MKTNGTRSILIVVLAQLILLVCSFSLRTHDGRCDMASGNNFPDPSSQANSAPHGHQVSWSDFHAVR